MIKSNTIMISAFSDKHINPTTENILVMLPALKDIIGTDMFPNVFISQNIDMETGNISSQSNLSFASSDEKYKIICMERIDIICSTNKAIECLDGEIEKCVHALEYLLEKANASASRLAFNVDYVLEQLSVDTILSKEFIKVIGFYDGKNIREWSTRTNSYEEISILGNKELVNTITDIEINSNDKGEKTYHYHIDINTLPGNQGLRFNQSHIHPFLSETSHLYKLINSDIAEIIK